nr:MAG TPA: hypothetical protein [Caudoviricetes sp.]
MGRGLLHRKEEKTSDDTSVYAHSLSASDCLDEFQ